MTDAKKQKSFEEHLVLPGSLEVVGRSKFS